MSCVLLVDQYSSPLKLINNFFSIMKKSLIPFMLFLCSTYAFAQELSKDDRSKMLNHLKQTQNELFATVKGLTTEQLNFRSSEDSWSIAECVEHIAISEKNIFGLVEAALQTEPDVSRRSEVQMSDEQVLGIITSREQKVKTRPEFEPEERFGDYAGSLKTFKERRKENLTFVKRTEEDLRNRYCTLPFGTIDACQAMLFLSGHVQRHTDQIKEIMESDQFPG